MIQILLLVRSFEVQLEENQKMNGIDRWILSIPRSRGRLAERLLLVGWLVMSNEARSQQLKINEINTETPTAFSTDFCLRFPNSGWCLLFTRRTDVRHVLVLLQYCLHTVHQVVIILCILTYSSTMHCILLSSSWGTTARSSNTKRVLQAGSSSVRSITVCIIYYKKYNIMHTSQYYERTRVVIVCIIRSRMHSTLCAYTYMRVCIRACMDNTSYCSIMKCMQKIIRMHTLVRDMTHFR